jgi:hypothetical protein
MRLPLLLSLALVATSTVAQAQPSSTDTQGFVDFRSATPGSPAANGWATGPYIAGFSTVSMTSAYSASAFNVFCIDVLGGAGDSRVLVQTFDQAVLYGPLVTKYQASGDGSVGGRDGEGEGAVRQLQGARELVVLPVQEREVRQHRHRAEVVFLDDSESADSGSHLAGSRRAGKGPSRRGWIGDRATTHAKPGGREG